MYDYNWYDAISGNIQQYHSYPVNIIDIRPMRPGPWSLSNLADVFLDSNVSHIGGQKLRTISSKSRD